MHTISMNNRDLFITSLNKMDYYLNQANEIKLNNVKITFDKSDSMESLITRLSYINVEEVYAYLYINRNILTEVIMKDSTIKTREGRFLAHDKVRDLSVENCKIKIKVPGKPTAIQNIEMNTLSS